MFCDHFVTHFLKFILNLFTKKYIAKKQKSHCKKRKFWYSINVGIKITIFIVAERRKSMQKQEVFSFNHLNYEKEYTDVREIKYDLHCHERYEIYYILHGDVKFLVEGYEYRPEPYSVLLIAPHRFHGLQVISDKPYVRCRIHFSPKLLTRQEQELLLGSFNGENIMFSNIKEYELERYMDSIEECQKFTQPLQDIAIRARLLSLLVQLFAISHSAVGGLDASDETKEILQYVNEHLTENIQLETLAKQFFMSKNHLTKIFKEATGSTVANYILQKRMSIAKGMLRAGEPATIVAEKLGYDEYTSFYRNYKKVFGLSPAKEIEQI